MPLEPPLLLSLVESFCVSTAAKIPTPALPPRTEDNRHTVIRDWLHTEMVYPPTDGQPTNAIAQGRESKSWLVLRAVRFIIGNSDTITPSEGIKSGWGREKCRSLAFKSYYIPNSAR